jgi:hypothetical protein
MEWICYDPDDMRSVFRMGYKEKNFGLSDRWILGGYHE